MLQECQNESGACNGLQPVGWPEYMYVQFISKEVLTRLNWILPPHYLHSHNIFGKNLRKVILTAKRGVVSSERKHHRPRRVRKGLPPEKKNQDLNRLERRIFCFWRSQYSLLSAHVPWCWGPNWFNSLRNRSKLNGKLVSFYRQIQKFSRRLFATLILSTFSTQELSFWRNWVPFL